MNNISSPWIWKGVSTTLQSGRYTLLYPRVRIMSINSQNFFQVLYIFTLWPHSLSHYIPLISPNINRHLGIKESYLPLCGRYDPLIPRLPNDVLVNLRQYLFLAFAQPVRRAVEAQFVGLVASRRQHPAVGLHQEAAVTASAHATYTVSTPQLHLQHMTSSGC